MGLAVGIDYCLFIVSRYRHELITGRSGEDAAGRAVGTAGDTRSEAAFPLRKAPVPWRWRNANPRDH